MTRFACSTGNGDRSVLSLVVDVEPRYPARFDDGHTGDKNRPPPAGVPFAIVPVPAVDVSADQAFVASVVDSIAFFFVSPRESRRVE